ncbi:hypothetical protein [Alteraurantiacibacter palmitatis]|uniref:hypothetical protein n=1 Tax=Alteraurantiacibacter palmitatis TaxID=2054628 RepID=UPI003671CB3B
MTLRIYAIRRTNFPFVIGLNNPEGPKLIDQQSHKSIKPRSGHFKTAFFFNPIRAVSTNLDEGYIL